MNDQVGQAFVSLGPPMPSVPEQGGWENRRGRMRIIIFIVVFIAAAAASLYVVFTQPPVYQSYALMTVGARNPDQRNQETGSQDIILQSQVLLSRDLLARVLAHMEEAASVPGNETLTLDGLRSMLQVSILEDSAVIKMVAEGPEKSVLPDLVNTWLDQYIQMNSNMQQAYSDETLTSLQGQLEKIQERIAEKQEALAEFRNTYDIVAMSRDENRIISKLKGLNASLSKATEARISAEANLKAVQDAIDQNKWAGNRRKPAELIRYEEEAQLLREEVRDLESRYTQKFIRLDKDTRMMVQKLASLEQRIESKYLELQAAALEEAVQEIDKARETERELARQIRHSENQAATFGKHFAVHESLKKDLDRLEELKRNLNEQIVSLDIKSDADMLQVKVIEPAFLPESPVRPDYMKDAGFAAGGSLLLAVFSLVLFDLLTRPPQKPDSPPVYPVTYNKILQGSPLPPQISGDRERGEILLPPALPAIPREMSGTEVDRLFHASPPDLQLVIATLLEGLAMEEILGLQTRDIDPDLPGIQVSGNFPRRVRISSRLAGLLTAGAAETGAPQGRTPLFEAAVSVEGIDRLLAQTARNAGIFDPDTVSAEVLRHTYVAYLARQGVSMDEIIHRVGYIRSDFLPAYGMLHPPGTDISIDDAETAYLDGNV